MVGTWHRSVVAKVRISIGTRFSRLAMASVFESGSGRTTASQASVPVHPDRIYIGLASGTQRTSSGKPVTIDGIEVDWDGKPQKNVDKVSITLFSLKSGHWTLTDTVRKRRISKRRIIPEWTIFEGKKFRAGDVDRKLFGIS